MREACARAELRIAADARTYVEEVAAVLAVLWQALEHCAGSVIKL